MRTASSTDFPSDPTILGDWGTSRLRLWLVAGTRIVAEREGPGIGALTGTPAAALLAALAPWRDRTTDRCSVVLCGMVGSRNGLAEVPYVDAPADAPRWENGLRRLHLDGFDVAIAPGLSCRNPQGAPDVMRGEETQLFGALALEPSLRRGTRVVVLPGTHSKWVQIEDGASIGFTTYITGELYALLKDHSTLLRAGGERGVTDGAFERGLERSERCGSGLAAAMFEARSAQLLAGRTGGWAAEFLSGLLIGAEVRASLAARPGAAAGAAILLIGDAGLTALYERALTHYRAPSERVDGNRCAIAGLQRLAGLARPEPAVEGSA